MCVRISERSHDPGCDVILHVVLGGSCQANPVIFNCLQVCCYDDHLDADILDSIHAIKVSQFDIIIAKQLIYTYIHTYRKFRFLLTVQQSNSSLT